MKKSLLILSLLAVSQARATPSVASVPSQAPVRPQGAFTNWWDPLSLE